MSFTQDQTILSDARVYIKNTVIFKKADVVVTLGTEKTVTGISAGGGVLGTAHSVDISTSPAEVAISVPSNMENKTTVTKWSGLLANIPLTIADPLTGKSIEIAAASLTNRLVLNFTTDGSIDLIFRGRYVS